MRRKNLGNRIVKKAITWAMIVMMSFSGAMSGFASMTVYAEETESSIDNRVDECDLEEERVDSGAEEYNNIETSGDQAAEEMTKKAEDAMDAAESAEKVVDDLGDVVAGLQEKADAATDAADNAETAAGDAEKDVEPAEAIVSGAEETKDEAVKEAAEYNNEAAKDQNSINSSASLSITDVTVETETEEGKKVVEQQDLSDFVTDQADDAKEAADEAKTALKDALKGESVDAVVETTDGEQKTVKELVADVNKAAEDAKEAADEAQTAVDSANTNLANAKKEYNKYAMMYGFALYGEDDPSYEYTDAVFERAGFDLKDDDDIIQEIKKHVEDKKTIEKKKQDVLKKELADLSKGITDAQEKVEDAREKATTADNAAKKAEYAAAEANALLTKEDKTGYADIAQKKADEAINVETTPAKDEYDDAVEDAKEKATKLAEAEDNKKVVDGVQNPIITQKETEKTALETELKNVNDTIDAQNKVKQEAQSTIDDLKAGTGFMGLGPSKLEQAQETMKAGLGHYETYYTWETGKWGIPVLKEHTRWVDTEEDYRKAEAVVQNYYNAEESLSNANKAIEIANNTKNDLTSQIASKDAEIQAANDAKAAAQRAVDDAQAAKDSADANVTEKRAVYDQAEDDKAKRLAKAESEAVESIIESLKKKLSENSNAINQVEYDKKLNTWANGYERYEDIDLSLEGIEEAIEIYKDAKSTRDWMDEEYKASKFEEIFNHLGLTQGFISTAQREETMDALIQAYRDAMVDYEKDLATITAYKADAKAENAVDTVDKQIKAIGEFETSISDAQKVIKDSNDKIEAAKDKYDDAVIKLNNIKDEVGNISLSGVDLTKLMAQIKKAEEEVKSTEEALKEAIAAKAAAQNYADWANALVSKHYTRSYAQALVDEGGNPILDENGKKQFSFANGKEFDTTDKGVIGRDPKYFIEVSKGAASTQVVPYSIYRAYVDAMYETYTVEEARSGKGQGKGISTGTLDKNNKYTDGSMSVLYWIIDENNKLTGDYLTEDKLVDGEVYFVGYTFKQHTDGYHIDGVLFKYSAPEEPTPGPSETPSPSETPAPSTTPTPGTSPAPTTTPGGGTTPDVTPDDGGDTTVIIPDAPVALAAAPVAADNGAAVLGARRTDGDAAEAAVLGARRGTEQAVLGKRRKPQTGDSAALNAWMAAMTMAAGAAGISGTKLAKGKKKEEKED